jgi:hypothetical protein
MAGRREDARHGAADGDQRGGPRRAPGRARARRVGLGEAIQISLLNEGPEQGAHDAATTAQLLSLLGQMLGASSGGRVPMPAAALRRAARYLEIAARAVADGGRMNAGLTPEQGPDLSAALRRDAIQLRTIAEKRG